VVLLVAVFFFSTSLRVYTRNRFNDQILRKDDSPGSHDLLA
jgi:hypothetical protein